MTDHRKSPEQMTQKDIAVWKGVVGAQRDYQKKKNNNYKTKDNNLKTNNNNLKTNNNKLDYMKLKL